MEVEENINLLIKETTFHQSIMKICKKVVILYNVMSSYRIILSPVLNNSV
jgi:hypothetical protein